MTGRGPRGCAAALSAVLLIALAGCGGVQETTVRIDPPPPIIVTDTTTPRPVGSLQLAVTGQPTRTFLVTGGRWKVCDRGTVTNAGSVVAADVRIVGVYVDKGVTVGETTREEAPANGGVLGDLQPGQSHDFEYCAITRNEPDLDRLTATARS